MNLTLKQHKEIRYSKDLTSYQIWEVMVNILREAGAPLCAYANMSTETALSCLAISTKNRRRISVHERADDLLVELFSELCRDHEPNEQARLDLLDVLLQKGVERNIIVEHIVYSLQTLRNPPFDKTKLVKHVGVYLDAYDTFKRDVVFRFYHLIQSSANKNHFVKNLHGLRSTKNDMFHVYMISSMRAIERFIPFKGTLADYIQTWFQNAEGSSDFITYDNEAFTLNRTVRKEVQSGGRHINNKAIPIHDRENSLSEHKEETLDTNFSEYSRLFAELPSSTIVFLAQNLPMILSEKQKQLIREHNKRMEAQHVHNKTR